jgi:hypothetical protein
VVTCLALSAGQSRATERMRNQLPFPSVPIFVTSRSFSWHSAHLLRAEGLWGNPATTGMLALVTYMVVSR